MAMTLKEALALRLPNGTPLGDASPDKLEAEAARLATVADTRTKGKIEFRFHFNQLLPANSGLLRDLAVQLAGHDMLKELGIAIVPASAPDFFTEDTPTAILVRQVPGAIAQFEKASAVAKLAAARKRKREREGRCEGRKPLSQTRPEVVALARKLRRRRPKGGQLSLRGVATELAARGFLNERGKQYAAKSVAHAVG